jgi:glycosyltransferase involved in cell wall biosynthesis
MRVAVFLNSLGLGGSEKAAAEWAQLLSTSPDITGIRVVALSDGPRRESLERAGIPLWIVNGKDKASALLGALGDCDVVHAHAPGFAHQGDVLGAVLKKADRKIPVVQTNIFGKLENPAEDEWTDFRCFISWTSCVQAAHRSGTRLDQEFFRRQSVAVYPVSDPVQNINFDSLKDSAAELRQSLGIGVDKVLFGRFSRPEPNKWTPLVLEAFLSAFRANPSIRLLLREPPPNVASHLTRRGLAAWGTESLAGVSHPIVLFQTTGDAHDLACSQLACDVILHTSSIGESFGYGIAEPMALGRPVITHSVPWHDQAQLELVHHGECGLVANRLRTMTGAILKLAGDKETRMRYGEQGRERILKLADPAASVAKLKIAMRCAVEQRDNPNASEDLRSAREAASNLDLHQWGHSLEECWHLRSRSAQVSFLRWQRRLRDRLKGHQSALV